MEMIGHTNKIDLEETSLAWGELGKGPPLVLLHGLMDTHRTWRRAAPLLAENFRVLMPDLPGNGLSGRPDAPYTLSWFADILAEWLEKIGVENAHICGHSYGGGIAQWMLLEHRDLIDRMALVSSGGLGRQVALGMRLASFPILGSMITPHALKAAMPTVLKYASATFGHMEAEEQEIFLETLKVPGTALAFQRTLEGVINIFGQYMQMSHRSAEVEQLPPVALFWGTKDPIIPIKHGKKSQTDAIGITLTRYKGCGHYPQLDFPRNFARDITEFLNDPHRLAAKLIN
jgi:pimeloyl-ACP methyl ester carboxylesterase